MGLKRSNLKTERTQRLSVISSDVGSYDGPAFVNHPLPANPTLNQALKALDDSGNVSSNIVDSYSNIGYFENELTYSYDISTIQYPGTFWVVIDNVPKFVGENIANQADFLAALNGLLLGTWTITDTTLSVVGFHQYGNITPTAIISAQSITLSIDTTPAVDMLNIWGSTWFDLSIENTLVGNTGLINAVKELNFSFLAFPTGAVIDWWHPVGTDGWGSIESDATDRGLDYETVQGGDLYNGGLPYGRKFFTEFQYFIDELEITRAVVGLNLASPLIPFSNDTIVWASVDYQAVKDEVDLIVAGVNATNANLDFLELGMELKTGAWEDLFVNTGGAETTKAQILYRLLTEVDAGTTILEYIRAALPNVIISMDGRLWDDGGNDDADWNEVLMQLDIVDVNRQYYQFKDTEAVSYAAVRQKVADRVDFWAFVEDSALNGKGVFLSQVTVKATSPIRNTAANGLLMAEIYMTLTKDNLDHDDKLVGACFMNIKQLFDVNDGYSTKVHYPFMVQLGSFFANNQKMVEIVSNATIVSDNIVMLATKVGTEIRVLLLNPTENDITVDELIIDGVVIPSNNLSVTQNYSTDTVDPVTEGVTYVTQNTLRLRPYSLSVVKTTPETAAAADTMMGLFGTALDNVGNYYTSLYSKTAFTDFVVQVGFQHGVYSSGAQDRWIHYVSKRGGFSLLPNNEALSTVSPDVGMRANTNEIYFYAGMTDDGESDEFSQAVTLHEAYNTTGQDFWARFKTYCNSVANMSMVVFTANLSHGTTTELGQYLTELESLGIPYKVRYGNEMSIGSSGAVTPETSMSSAEYIAKVIEFDDYVKANFPNAKRVVNLAIRDRSGWTNANVVATAIDQGIEEFSQYLWLGDNAGNSPGANTSTNIDVYFALALDYTRDNLFDGNNSLYGEVLPRLQDYYDLAYPLRMHVGQYGCSLQRTGYVANTMLHGLMIWNELFEFFKFNYTHDNFVSSAVFLMNESAVSVITAQDALFSIDPSYVNGAGADTFVKRIQGVAYELLKPLSTYSGGYPVFIPVTITNQPLQFDIVAFEVDSVVYLWIYNINDAEVIQSILVDGVAMHTAIDVTGCNSTELYGSIGSSPAYNYFKDFPVDSPDLEPTDIVPISELGTSSSNVDIPEHSILKIKLTGVTTAAAITVNLNPPA